LTEHVDLKCTDKNRPRYATKHLVDFFGNVKISKLTRQDTRDYRTWRIDHGAADPTIRRELGVLVAACGHAAKERRIERAQIPYLDLPPSAAPKDRWLTKEEAVRLLQAARYDRVRLPNGLYSFKKVEGITRTYLFCLIALRTASRKDVIEKLKWSQVDLANKLIYRNPPGRVETKKRRPPVPISSMLYEVLVKAQEAATTAEGGQWVLKSPWVLGHPGNTRSAFKSACKRAGLQNVTPHTLRHTWATWAAQRGRPMWEIAAILGDTLATVEKVYAHHHPDYLRATINAVDDE
jgi:integrase